MGPPNFREIVVSDTRVVVVSTVVEICISNTSSMGHGVRGLVGGGDLGPVLLAKGWHWQGLSISYKSVKNDSVELGQNTSSRIDSLRPPLQKGTIGNAANMSNKQSKGTSSFPVKKRDSAEKTEKKTGVEKGEEQKKKRQHTRHHTTQ